MTLRLPRLIDLHADWLLQYAPETTVFDPALYPRIADRLGQTEGYLQATSVAFLSCYRDPRDWSRQADPWAALGDLITRIEAEFPGRLLHGPDDVCRWLDAPDGLGWGVLGVEGFDLLARSSADLERLPRLFERGVRLFQPVETSSSLLGGSSAADDHRGLTDLGRAFLQTLADVGPSSGGPRPLLDLAGLNPASVGEVLDWFEADPDRSRRLIPVLSHGAMALEGFANPRALSPDPLKRLRALGGLIGLGVGSPFHATADALKADVEAIAAIPFEGRLGFEGIALATCILGRDPSATGLETAEQVVAWTRSNFDPSTSDALIAANARRLLARAIGEPSG